MDRWVFDTFTLYDHDYMDQKYVETLSKYNYKIFANWACLYQDELNTPLEADIRIIVLGGSTTSAILESTWSYHLYRELSQFTTNLAILNGGCGTYNSFSEFMKLNRDISSINPTHVLSLSGVNDTVVPNKISNGFAKMLIEPLVKGNLFTRFNDCIPEVARPIRWIEETLHMNSICNNYNADFMRFLQPCLGSPCNPTSSMSPVLLDMIINSRRMFGEQYVEYVDYFYRTIVSSQLPSCIKNISALLPNHEDLWQDSRHPSDKGYLLIAQEIMKTIKPSLT
ncbi:hypothetical protein [Prochlorococcus marinus]|uniref:SGNH hydrolase-type esterase domain-containing protein n=1 Tax=Prochlorococcus marinus (strain MIT 9303) TaxID=59922 RepID=A2CA27_PROM3|nr:hypothetical protein [Prochlorococcus marinus]ABM78337.1 Hypothetical protein P9303_15931 [Prochlorococcus marinus str. MIT 9303]